MLSTVGSSATQAIWPRRLMGPPITSCPPAWQSRHHSFLPEKGPASETAAEAAKVSLSFSWAEISVGPTNLCKFVDSKTGAVQPGALLAFRSGRSQVRASTLCTKGSHVACRWAGWRGLTRPLLVTYVASLYGPPQRSQVGDVIARTARFLVFRLLRGQPNRGRQHAQRSHCKEQSRIFGFHSLPHIFAACFWDKLPL